MKTPVPITDAHNPVGYLVVFLNSFHRDNVQKWWISDKKLNWTYEHEESYIFDNFEDAKHVLDLVKSLHEFPLDPKDYTYEIEKC